MGRFGSEVGRAVRPRSRAELLTAGVSRPTLAGPRWRQAALGWHVPAAAAETPVPRIVEAVTLVPDGCLSGWAAAYVLGADVLDGRDPLTGRQDVRVVRPPGSSRIVIPAVRCVRAELDEQETFLRHGSC